MRYNPPPGFKNWYSYYSKNNGPDNWDILLPNK